MYQLSRIDAVNEIMRLKSSDRVTTESELNTLPQAVEAGIELDMAVTRVLVNYKWFFNDIENGQLLTNDDGEAILPSNITYISFLQTDAPVPTTFLRPVDGKVYDAYNHTFNLGTGRTIRYNGKLHWGFESLPVAFQLLAVAEARRHVVKANAHLSATRASIEEAAFNEAFTAALKFDDTLSGGRIRDPQPSRRRPPHNNGWL